MKYTIIILTAIFIAGGLLISNYALAEDSTSTPTNSLKMQIENLKNIFNNLQDKIKGIKGIENKLENIGKKVEKFDGIKNVIQAVVGPQIKPGKQGMQVEELGNGTIQVHIKNAQITEIDKTNNIIKVKIFGLVGKVHILPDTKILKESWVTSIIDQFAIGDYVNVFGERDATDLTLVNAKTIRDVTLTATEIKNRVCVQTITQAQNPRTQECKEFPTPCHIPKDWTIGCNATSTCQNLYWFDNAASSTCGQKSFCGAYMYQGLRTFSTLPECQSVLTNATSTSQ